MWSCSASAVLSFPARWFFRFLRNHGLVDVVLRPQWYTVRHRTAEGYVRRVSAAFATNVRCNAAVRSLEATADGRVQLVLAVPSDRSDKLAALELCSSGAIAAAGCEGLAVGGPAVGAVGVVSEAHNVVECQDRSSSLVFDAVVLATHAPQSAVIAGGLLSESQREWLASFHYACNDVWVHSDASLMPSDRTLWASWNVLVADDDSQPPFVSYFINRLQNLPLDAPDIFVSLNPIRPPAASLTYHRLRMAHPTPTGSAVAAQRCAGQQQGSDSLRALFFAGAYMRFGFHEDACRAGVAAANALLARRCYVAPPRVLNLRSRVSSRLTVIAPYRAQRWLPAHLSWASLAARTLILRHMRQRIISGRLVSFGRVTVAEARQ